MDFILKLIGMIPESNAAIVGIVTGVVDFILRMIPSEKPKGIIWLVKDFCKALALLFGKVAEFLDKVLPQKLIENKPE